MTITLRSRSSSLIRASLIYLIDGLIAAISLVAAISLRVGSLRAEEVLRDHLAAMPLFYVLMPSPDAIWPSSIRTRYSAMSMTRLSCVEKIKVVLKRPLMSFINWSIPSPVL